MDQELDMSNFAMDGLVPAYFVRMSGSGFVQIRHARRHTFKSFRIE